MLTRENPPGVTRERDCQVLGAGGTRTLGPSILTQKNTCGRVGLYDGGQSYVYAVLRMIVKLCMFFLMYDFFCLEIHVRVPL